MRLSLWLLRSNGILRTHYWPRGVCSVPGNMQCPQRVPVVGCLLLRQHRDIQMLSGVSWKHSETLLQSPCNTCSTDSAGRAGGASWQPAAQPRFCSSVRLLIAACWSDPSLAQLQLRACGGVPGCSLLCGNTAERSDTSPPSSCSHLHPSCPALPSAAPLPARDTHW